MFLDHQQGSLMIEALPLPLMVKQYQYLHHPLQHPRREEQPRDLGPLHGPVPVLPAGLGGIGRRLHPRPCRRTGDRVGRGPVRPAGASAAVPGGPPQTAKSAMSLHAHAMGAGGDAGRRPGPARPGPIRRPSSGRRPSGAALAGDPARRRGAPGEVGPSCNYRPGGPRAMLCATCGRRSSPRPRRRDRAGRGPGGERNTGGRRDLAAGGQGCRRSGGVSLGRSGWRLRIGSRGFGWCRTST